MASYTYYQNKDFIEEVFDGLLENVISHITRKFRPDEVFEEHVLKEWALNNGFIEEE